MKKLSLSGKRRAMVEKPVLFAAAAAQPSVHSHSAQLTVHSHSAAQTDTAVARRLSPP